MSRSIHHKNRRSNLLPNDIATVSSIVSKSSAIVMQGTYCKTIVIQCNSYTKNLLQDNDEVQGKLSKF